METRRRSRSGSRSGSSPARCSRTSGSSPGVPRRAVGHTFGISNLSPCVLPDPTPPPPQKSLTVLTNPLNWYWGEGVGHVERRASRATSSGCSTGIQAAGPKLTPKTFQQGLFSIPASGGAAQGYPTGCFTGYGRTSGLPYDEYLSTGSTSRPCGGTPRRRARRTAPGARARVWPGTRTGRSATAAARCRRSRSAGSTRRPRSSSSTRGRRRLRSTSVTARVPEPGRPRGAGHESGRVHRQGQRRR